MTTIDAEREMSCAIDIYDGEAATYNGVAGEGHRGSGRLIAARPGATESGCHVMIDLASSIEEGTYHLRIDAGHRWLVGLRPSAHEGLLLVVSGAAPEWLGRFFEANPDASPPILT